MQQNPRDFTEEELARIIAAMKERAPKFEKCPLDGTDQWGVGPGYVTLPIQPQRASGSIMIVGGPNFPMLTFICQHCGYTILMNIYNLGVADLFGFAPSLKTEEVATVPEPQLDDPSKPPV